MANVTVDGEYSYQDMLGTSQSTSIDGTALFEEIANADYIIAASGIITHNMGTLAHASFLHVHPTLGDVGIYLNGGSQPIPVRQGGDLIIRDSAIDAISIETVGPTNVAVRALGA